MGRRVSRAGDLNLDLDKLPARPVSDADGAWVYLEGCEPWEALIHDATMEGRCACPVCKEHPKRRHYCLHCDRTGLDGRATFPGLSVDAAPDPTYPSPGTSYKPPQDGLKGGREKLAAGFH